MQNRRGAWAVCLGIQYLGLFWVVLGQWVHASPFTILLAVTMQIAGVLGFEGAYSRFRLLPGSAEIRRKFYRTSVWAFALLPCQVLSSLLFRFKWFGIRTPTLHLPVTASLYLAVCLPITVFLRPRKPASPPR